MFPQSWKNRFFFSLIFLSLAAALTPAAGKNRHETPLGQPSQSLDFKELPAAGKNCPIDDQFFFVYEFTAEPKLGTAILRVRIFDKHGEKIAVFKVIGRSDMPSMSGGHDSGDQEFKLNRKNDYLLPVNIVMPGEWEVRLTFSRGDAPVFRGSFRFNV